MPAGVIRLTDLVIPAIFTPMVLRELIERTELLRSGAAYVDPVLENFLAGAGVTVVMPKLNPIDTGDVENVSSDDPTVHSTPNKANMGSEIAVRLSRNQSWSQMDLARSILAADPLAALVSQVAEYWARRRQRAMIAHVSGIFANNAQATDEYHVKNDMTVNLAADGAGAALPYTKGVTDFNGGSFIDAFATMGDQMGQIALVGMHSVVYASALKQNLIEFRLDSDARPTIPTYMGKDVFMDDSMPASGGLFDTWLFGRNSIGIGTDTPEVPTEALRIPSSGNGAGQEILWSRIEWAHHVQGTTYLGQPPAGGPLNAATTNNLAAASSWRRVAQSRKHVPIARLVTREF